MLKRLLLLLLIPLSAMLAHADYTFQYTYEGQTLNYEAISEGAKTCKVMGCMYPDRYLESTTKFTIPEVAYDGLNEYKVTAIGEEAFSNCIYLTSITIPDYVYEIGDAAFYGCEHLPSIALPDNVRTIGRSAFAMCLSLTSLAIPPSVQSIGVNAFDQCRFQKFAYPDHLDLTNASLSIFDAEGPIFSYPSGGRMENGVIFGPRKGGIYFVPIDMAGDFVIPESVTEIGDFAFSLCRNLTSVTIPNSVTTIGIGAFGDCSSMATVLIPNEVTTIENRAFYRCSSLTNVIIPSSVTSILDGAFGGCTSLASVFIPASVTSIGRSVFSRCALSEVVIPSSVKSIGAFAFAENVGLQEVKIGCGLEEVGENAFIECSKIENVYITAKEPPTASDNTFSRYESALWLNDQESVDLYYNAPQCWNLFKENMFSLVPIERLSAPTTEISGSAGESIKLEVEISPADATLQEIFWSSTNPDVATVDNEGNVTLVSANTGAKSRAASDECHIIASTMYADSPVLDFVVTVSPESGIYDIYVDDSDATRPSANAGPSARGVYNLQGRYVGATTEGLPAGLYIANGRKTVVK